jgi:triosephosphate isomerase
MKTVKQRIVVGNWKMNPRTVAEAIDCAKKIARNLPKKSPTVLLAVPTPFLRDIHKAVKIKVGMQSIATEQEGAHTGLSSATQGMSVGATFTIIGHSEERARGTTDETLAKQIQTACTLKLPFILCVGESVRDKEGVYLRIVSDQLSSALTHLSPRHLPLVTIAYEPIWAISKDVLAPATPKECLEVVIAIKRFLSDTFGAKKAALIPILYGGSASKENAALFMRTGGVDGLLVGHESLRPKNFAHIITEVGQV